MKNKNEVTIRSSAAEYLTYIASVGDSNESLEMRYEEENIWLTQKMMAALYDVSLPTINEHIKKIYDDAELVPNSTIRKFYILMAIEYPFLAFTFKGRIKSLMRAEAKC